MSTPDHATVDAFLREALVASSAGVDLDLTDQTIQTAQKALLKQSKALEQADYDTHEVSIRCASCGKRGKHLIDAPSPDVVARAAAHTSKVVDGIVRMAQFAKGQPDSRPDMKGDWLRVLPDDKLRIVQGWMDELAQGEK
jgi:hypothetical protein